MDNKNILIIPEGGDGIPVIFNEETVIFLEEDSRKHADEIAVKTSSSIKITS